MSINGKKAFQLYHDMAGVVGVMTDEQAGKLLKAILTYVNGNEPENLSLLCDPCHTIVHRLRNLTRRVR